MQTAPPVITAAPTDAPQRGVKATFSLRLDAFVTWLYLAVAQFGAVATNVYNNAVDAWNSAQAAAASAASALGYANNAAASAAAAVATTGVALWVSGASVAQYAAVISPADARTYRRKTATGSGTTDPSIDPTNYVLISNFGYFQSADQTITSGGLLTLSHGLGRTPIMFNAFIKCTTTEAEYSVGDITPVNLGGHPFGSSTITGVSITADATNIYIRYVPGTSVFGCVSKTSGNNSTLTNSKWSFLVRALA